MFSLQKLFSRDEQFFERLEASAESCRVSVQALKHVIANGSRAPTMDEFGNLRHNERQIRSEITELLAHVSVTALEREDIEALSNALYNIPKTLEKAAERYLVAASELRDVDFSRHVILLEQATDITVQMLKCLRQGFDMAQIAKQNAILQRIEADADDLILDLLKTELYSRKHDALKVIILKDVYELLEKGVDRCRDAGNTICAIVLKNT